MSDQIAKTSKINFTVNLDKDKLPVTMDWHASDSGQEAPEACKGLMISIWDPKVKSSLRIDLWTKDLLVEEMKQFFYETIASMADTYERATADKEVAAEMRDFSVYFADKAKLFEAK
jgi:gliding motility-associated protein GldC